MRLVRYSVVRGVAHVAAAIRLSYKYNVHCTPLAHHTLVHTIIHIGDVFFLLSRTRVSTESYTMRY